MRWNFIMKELCKKLAVNPVQPVLLLHVPVPWKRNTLNATEYYKQQIFRVKWLNSNTYYPSVTFSCAQSLFDVERKNWTFFVYLMVLCVFCFSQIISPPLAVPSVASPPPHPVTADTTPSADPPRQTLHLECLSQAVEGLVHIFKVHVHATITDWWASF